MTGSWSVSRFEVPTDGDPLILQGRRLRKKGGLLCSGGGGHEDPSEMAAGGGIFFNGKRGGCQDSGCYQQGE